MKHLNSVCEKLKEADFFLEKMVESERAEIDLNYFFSAFSSAARSVTFVIQYVASDVVGFAEWYEGVRTRQSEDKIAKFLLEARNQALKTGSQPISFGQVTVSPSGEEMISIFFKYVGSDPPADVPIIDVFSTCRHQMRNLVAIASEFFEKFEDIIWDEARDREETLSQITQLQPVIHGGVTSDDLWQKIIEEIHKLPVSRPSNSIKRLREKYINSSSAGHENDA